MGGAEVLAAAPGPRQSLRAAARWTARRALNKVAGGPEQPRPTAAGAGRFSDGWKMRQGVYQGRAAAGGQGCGRAS